MSEKNIVVVNEKEYQVIKTGRAQAEQVVQLTRWISKHGVKAIKSMQSADGSVTFGDNTELLGKVADALTTDALIDLFQLLIGCSKEDAELFFDISVLVDVAVEVYNRQTAVRKLVGRFFSGINSGADSGASSTTSEQPTDIPTTK
jgi:hypothetical protein